ncbi:MAG: hypothetical protein ACTH9L_09770, partial [Microbacterium gubbeenense]
MMVRRRRESMKIIVICGAGASSTFVATRLRRAAEAAGTDVEAVPASRSSFAGQLGSADAVLVAS